MRGRSGACPTQGRSDKVRTHASKGISYETSFETRMRKKLITVLLLVWAGAVHAFDHTHAAWNTLLAEHVSWSPAQTATRVDYAGMRKQHIALRAYLTTLEAVSEDDFSGWSREQRRAFLINAYNAFTVELILRAESLPKSIKDLGSFIRGPWKQAFFSLFGDERHLDELEHSMLRGDAELADPRLHFALNCAAIGCPALRPEAYVPSSLEAQLDDQTRRFLSDRTRNRVRADGTLEVSKIFDWYEEDFGMLGFYLSRHAVALGLGADAAAKLAKGMTQIEFLDYDWRLNNDFGG